MRSSAPPLDIELPSAPPQEPIGRAVPCAAPSLYTSTSGSQTLWKTLVFVSGLLFAVCFMFGVLRVDRGTMMEADEERIYWRKMNSALAKNGVPITDMSWNAAETKSLMNTPYLNGAMVALDPPSLQFYANITLAGTLFIGCLLVSVAMLAVSVDRERFSMAPGMTYFYVWGHNIVFLGVCSMLAAGLVYMYVATLSFAEIYLPHYTWLLASKDGPGFSLDDERVRERYPVNNPDLLTSAGYHQTIALYGLFTLWFWLGTGLVMLMVPACVHRLSATNYDYATTVKRM